MDKSFKADIQTESKFNTQGNTVSIHNSKWYRWWVGSLGQRNDANQLPEQSNLLVKRAGDKAYVSAVKIEKKLKVGKIGE